MTSVSIQTAISLLDPDGGWDHERSSWPNSTIHALSEAETAELTESDMSFGSLHWRLTYKGILERRKLDENLTP